MIERWLSSLVDDAVRAMPAVAILGPRQSGKSTLAHAFCDARGTPVVYLDLERPQDLAKLRDPEAFFAANPEGLICIDEIQRAPDLFSVMRHVIDQRARPAQFLILGSASRDLIRQSSETLAGRIRYLELTPFLRSELDAPDDMSRRYWLRGGFPRSLLAPTDAESFHWRTDFRMDFLERDIPALSRRLEPASIGRLWEMLAHVHGQLLNMATLASSLGVDGHTVSSHIDLLEGAFMVRRLRPVHANLRKRLVKTPKLYFRDTGILHAILRIESWNDLMSHPCFGYSWEGLCIGNILAQTKPGVKAGFYRTARGAEIDLLLERGAARAAIEFKAASSPAVERGFHTALDDLGLARGWVVAPIETAFQDGRITFVPLHDLATGELSAFLH